MSKSYQVANYKQEPIWLSYRFNSIVPQYVCDRSGLVETKDVAVGHEIWTQLGWSKILDKQQRDVASRLYFARCGLFIGPPDGKVINEGRKKMISEVASFDLFYGPKVASIIHDPQFIMDGLMIGDGSAFNKEVVYLNIGEKDGDYFESEVASLIKNVKTSTHDLGWEVTTNIRPDELPKLPSRSVPERYLTFGNAAVASFLRGLFSANGCISSSRISIRSTNLRLICQVQIMLSSLGITSYYSVNKPRMTKWHNGNYVSKESYDLSINKDRGQYLKLIGFLQGYKMAALKVAVRNSNSYGAKENYEIITKEDCGPQTIYGLKVNNKYNTWWCNCLNVCGI